MTGSPPVFGPDEPDPEPDADDVCRGGRGADFGFHCETLLSAQGPSNGMVAFSWSGNSYTTYNGWSRR